MTLSNSNARRQADGLRFVEALAPHRLPVAERLIIQAFEGDPDTAEQDKWMPRGYRPGHALPCAPGQNAYVAVSSFHKADDGKWRRRKECFASGLAFMVDDVVQKVPREAVESLAPSARVETSPGSEQWWWFLSSPEPDVIKFGGLSESFIKDWLIKKYGMEKDPGMAGVTRVGRLPGFVNGKKRHNGWVCKLHELRPKRRFSVDQLARAFGLRIEPPPPPLIVSPGDRAELEEAYARVESYMRGRGMLKGRPSPSGWLTCTCPWQGNHTGGGTTGAAIRRPASENGHTGAFRCHHSGCADNGWAELTQFIDEQIEEEMNEIGRNAPRTLAALRRR